MGIKLITEPALEPITIQEARDHLRVVDEQEDSYIEQLIKAARGLVEVHSGARAMITQTWLATFDAFPGWWPIKPSLVAWPSWGSPRSRIDREGFVLARSPAQEITEFSYIDIDGAEQVLDPSVYRLVDDEAVGRVILKYGQTWPSARDEQGAIRIEFKAGYGDAPEDVPAAFRHAIKLIVAHLYENREPYVTGTITTEIPMTARTLLMSEGIIHIR